MIVGTVARVELLALALSEAVSVGVVERGELESPGPGRSRIGTRLESGDDADHVELSPAVGDRALVELATGRDQRVGGAGRVCRRLGEPRVLEHVGDRRLRRQVAVGKLLSLAPRYDRRHGPGVEHVAQNVRVDAGAFGEVKGSRRRRDVTLPR